MKLFAIFLIIGFFINHLFPYISTSINFNIVAIILLVLGLYASVYEIDIKILGKHKQLVLSALTFGVLLKSIFIGTVFFLMTKSFSAFLFGVVVAQIDPLSVSHLLKSKDKSFSVVGRTILHVWSSFDDPITILLSLFLIGPLVLGTFYMNPLSYLIELAVNILFATVVFFLTRFIFQEKSKKILLFFCLIISVVFNLTLGIALISLFLKPKFGKELAHTVTIAFYTGILLLGLTLKFTVVGILSGIFLGAVAYSSQIIATLVVARKLTKSDKMHLAFAQYNGITSIALSIFFVNYFSSMTGIIAVAVITINCIYYIINRFLG